jgi:hypothetical protein
VNLPAGAPDFLPVAEFFPVPTRNCVHASLDDCCGFEIGNELDGCLGALATLFAGYVTMLNAFQITKSLIEREDSFYTVFQLFAGTGITLTLLFYAALQMERYKKLPQGRTLTFGNAIGRTGFAVVLVGGVLLLTCTAFNDEFLTRLQSIYSMKHPLRWFVLANEIWIPASKAWDSDQWFPDQHSAGLA